MWRATWILYFSFYVLSATAQGRKDGATSRGCARGLGAARRGAARRGGAADGAARLLPLRAILLLSQRPSGIFSQS